MTTPDTNTDALEAEALKGVMHGYICNCRDECKGHLDAGAVADQAIYALAARASLVDQLEAALGELANEIHWQQVEWMHLHELNMSDPFKAEAEVLGFLSETEIKLRDLAALARDTERKP